MKLRVTGLRVTHSSDGSSSGDPPHSKRSQHRPPRPQVPSTPSLNCVKLWIKVLCPDAAFQSHPMDGGLIG
ncbi:hypothetical protein V7S43_015483 [Phytophthora oleae]|uniref:Uncharacterized protein n=1 Tax=Phytophthora oleae TaxID=2107226 RepID=A0ABD3EY67_9STRA